MVLWCCACGWHITTVAVVFPPTQDMHQVKLRVDGKYLQARKKEKEMVKKKKKKKGIIWEGVVHKRMKTLRAG